jgi:hypothetical protein
VRHAAHWVLIAAAGLALPGLTFAQVPTIESHFGFRMGGGQPSAEAIEGYFEQVAARSDRVKIVDIGPTTEGRRTIAAIISSADNIRNLDQIQANNQGLADPRTLSPEEASRLAATSKVVLAIGAGIHASESGGPQATTELLYRLATDADPELLGVLDRVVVVLIPMLNPDGARLVAAWNQAVRGTPYEGASMPWLYHKYAGHEINRDAFMLNLAESRNLARFFQTAWHPQVFLSLHQMDGEGPRMYVPPVADPIGRNYDPLIWREAAVLAGAMALSLQRDGRSGVVSNAPYDYYWPGYEDSAPLGHNTVCLLAEVASPSPGPRAPPASAAQSATPPKEPTINNPDPWHGGVWTLRDVVDYDLSAARGLLAAASNYHALLVQNFYDMGRRAIDLGGQGGPFAFIIPPEQFDPHATAKLERLLIDGGIEIHRALEPFRADGDPYPGGSDIILLAQPYRAFVKTLLERQDYPGSGQPRHAQPYDVTGWTLPAQMGVDVRTIERTFEPPAMSRLSVTGVAAAKVWGDVKSASYVIEARGNGGALALNRLVAAGIQPTWLVADAEVNGYRYAPGSLVVPASSAVRPVVEQIAKNLGLRVDGVRRPLPNAVQPVGTARVALYKPWVPNADEGWTRWLLDQYEFRYTSITDTDIRAGNLRQRFDVIILPSAPADLLKAGNTGEVPPDYRGGLGESGVTALRAFVEGGGTLVCLDQSAALAIDEFHLPLRDLAREGPSSEFFCPGSILRIDLDPRQPLSFGMNPHTAGMFRSGSAYAIEPRAGAADPAIAVAASYGAKDLLISGWLEGEQVIAGKPAALEVRLGMGRIVLFGFSTQHRGESHATFRLFFNAVFTAAQNGVAKTAPR